MQQRENDDFATPSSLGLSLERYGMSRPVELADRARGSLLAGAIGDALGRPAEGRRLDYVRQRWGRITDF